MAVEPKAPRAEKGQPAFAFGMPEALPGWNTFIDDREYVADLQWPASVARYQTMQSDAQLRGLLMATTLPVRRFLWSVNPNGAQPVVVDHIAESRNLPIQGQEAPKQTRGFNHDRHLAFALQAFAGGHYYFEELYEYRADGRVHLVKLGTRPPRTISNFDIARDGTLRAVEQQQGMASGAIFGAGINGTRLDANRLLAYVWQPQDDADWVGQSILRACYRNWLVKDRLIRVDATKHERNAMGIPWFETNPNATGAQIESLAEIAEEMRASERGGGAGPGKLRIAGVEGQLPDTIQSVRYHDEQMAKNFLALFWNLGGDAAHGSRALGADLIDFHSEILGMLADWYVEATQEQINREVAYNWGPDEQCPTLTYTRLESSDLAFSDLALGIEKGAIAVDEALEAYVRERWKLPDRSEPVSAPPTPPAALPAPGPAPTPTPPVAAASGPQNAPKRSKLAAQIEAVVTRPMLWGEVARAVGSDPKNGTARRARDELVNAGALVKRLDSKGAAVLAPLASIKLPDRDLRRQPYPFEVSASVNFAQMEADFLTNRESLVEAVKSMQGAQIDELAAKVQAAAGDAAKLAKLSVEPVDADVIAEHLLSSARAGEAAAEAERAAQVGPSASGPVAAAEVNRDKVDRTVTERAEAVSLTLAGGFAAAASKRATAVSTLAPEAAAEDVRGYLGGLSDAELDLQLGGATHQSYNTGRREVMRVAKPQSVYASEILDGNTCQACTGIDGTEWPNVAEAEVAYPIGGFVECEAGLRCRGTLVATY